MNRKDFLYYNYLTLSFILLLLADMFLGAQDQRGARTRHPWTLRRGFEAVTQPCLSSAPSRKNCGALSHPSARSHPARNPFTAKHFCFFMIICQSIYEYLYFCTRPFNSFLNHEETRLTSYSFNILKLSVRTLYSSLKNPLTLKK